MKSLKGRLEALERSLAPESNEGSESVERLLEMFHGHVMAADQYVLSGNPEGLSPMQVAAAAVALELREEDASLERKELRERLSPERLRLLEKLMEVYLGAYLRMTGE